MRAYACLVSIRKLFAVLVALAGLFAPGGTGAAMAAHPHHHMQMMEAGHCETPPANSGDHQKMTGKSCCFAMCIALAVTPSAPTEAVELAHAATYFAVPQSWQGFLGEIATPP